MVSSVSSDNSNSLPLLWKRCCDSLLQTLGQTQYDLWIARLVPLALEDTNLTLGISKQLFLCWLETNYKQLIEDAFSAVVGRKCQIKFQTLASQPQEAAPSESAKPAPRSHRPLKVAVPVNDICSRLNKHYTFDNFIVGNSNQFAQCACLAVGNAPGSAYNPLFIHSASGLGKTHLLNAIAWKIAQTRPSSKIECLTSEDFGNQFHQALSSSKLPAFREHFRNLDALLIDDVQFFVGKKCFQEEVFHTFNQLLSRNRQIVITSDRPPQEIEGLADRLVSRFESGLQAEITIPDEETRLAILLRKQEDSSVKFPTWVLERIASGIRTNVRRLEGALNTLTYSCQVFNKSNPEVSKDFVEYHLRKIFQEEELHGVTDIGVIQRVVAEYFQLRLSDMTSSLRPANIAYARQIAMFLARKHTNLSLPAIAEDFHKQHTTVLYALKAIEKKSQTSVETRRDLNQIEKILFS